MKATGKIGVFLFLMLFLFPFIGLLIQQVIGITEMRLTTASTLLALIAPYFFTYSKWANDNIWNTKTSKPTNTSYSSSEKVVEPIDEPVDDNHDILGNINLPSLSTKEENEKETLLKIEELKRQIESLLESKENLENSLKEDEEDVLSLADRQRIAEEKAWEDYRIIVFCVVGVVFFMGIIAWFAAMADN